MSLLSIRDLRVEFGTPSAPLRAVKGVSLELAPGETLGLVGESGSGKSLTCRAILRLIPQPGRIAGGSISFDGRDVLALSHRDLRALRARDVGFVFQDPFSSLNPVFRIGAQLAETLRLGRGLGRAAARAEALELLAHVDIPDPERRYLAYPHELSGGMRQRVMIALATASNPRLLLADEPTTALDVTTQAQILALLARMRSELGMAVLLVSHDFGVIAQFCDRVAVMYGGYIVETGDVQTVYERPHHPYTQALLESVPKLESAGHPARRDAIPGQPPELTEVPVGCAFAPRCRYAEDRCRAIEMELLTVAPDHASACPVRPREASVSPAGSTGTRA
jgi:oligopeptide/dipeptide ABC transporter ATP-binding protein